MWTRKQPTKEERAKNFRRGMLRSAFVSLFWVVIASKREREKYKLQSLADALGIDKSVTSKWFISEPNWQIDTIADIADALDVELQIQATERSTGIVYSPYGPLNFIKEGPRTSGVPTVHREGISIVPETHRDRIQLGQAA